MTEPSDTPVREPRVPPSWSPAGVYPELREKRVYLDRLRIHHLDLTSRFMTVDEGRVYWTDVLVITVMARSYSLVDGFLSTFDNWNPIVAAPIVRMQIDNLVRLAYAARGKSDDVAKFMVEGGELRKLKDHEGKRLTDSRLVELAAESHPWLSGVYKATSGWVHLSPQILHSIVEFREEEEAAEEEDLGLRLAMGVPMRRERIPVRAMRELLILMTRATEELFGYVEGWESRKGLPLGEVRDLRRS